MQVMSFELPFHCRNLLIIIIKFIFSILLKRILLIVGKLVKQMYYNQENSGVIISQIESYCFILKLMLNFN
jgi:hypothetical protein